MSRAKNKIHSVSGPTDAKMAAALGYLVTADCGYRWVPEKFGDECDGLKRCEECFPPAKEKKSRGPSLYPHDDQPHYVYRCFDATGRLIYVGCSVNPVARLEGHAKRAWWGDQIVTTRLVVFPTRRYALSKETEAIRTEHPRWNVKGKWSVDRSFWIADDYMDLRNAVVRAAKVVGPSTTALLADIDNELEKRFGVTAITRRPA